MIRGVAIAFATYAIFSCADATLKAAGGRLHVIEITFIATIFSCIVVFFAKPKTERWVDMFRMQRPWPVLLRAGAGIAAALLSAYAFTTLPLAEAYSLLFLLPAFVAILSVVLLGESLSPARLFALLVGLAGVLLVVRPGFKEVLPGHFAAIGTAFCGSLTILVLRSVGRSERQVTLIGTLMVGALIVNGALMAFIFKTPTLREVFFLALCGTLAGFGHLGLMAATRNAPANRIGPVQYSQIIWAVVLGGLFFGEFPDWISLVGLGLVLISGLFNFLRESGAGERPAFAKSRPG